MAQDLFAGEPITVKLRRVQNNLKRFVADQEKRFQSQSFLQVKSTTSAKLALRNYANTQFVGEVGIGEPPQYLNMIFDTGSSNIWVNSALCHQSSCRSHPYYDHSLSQDYEIIGNWVQVEFGTGSIEGYINSDSFHVSGLKISRQSICEISAEYGDVFDEGEFSGILGLAFPSGAAFDQVPLFDNIMNQGLIGYNLFAFYYSINEQEDAEISFGAVNPHRFTGDIIWTDIIHGESFYWIIQIDDILYDGVSINACTAGCIAAVDTGTSLITGPSREVDRLINLMDFDCIDYANAPDIEFIIEGYRFVIKASDYVVTVTQEGEDIPGFHSDAEDITDCTIAVMPLDVQPPLQFVISGPLWVLGDMFFSHYYTIFDRDNERVGFATAVHGRD